MDSVSALLYIGDIVSPLQTAITRVVFERRQQQSFSDIRCIYQIEKENIERDARANGEIAIEYLCLLLAAYGVCRKSHIASMSYISIVP